MFLCRLCLLFIFLHTTCSNWVSEWLAPVQQEYKAEQNLKNWDAGKDKQLSASGIPIHLLENLQSDYPKRIEKEKPVTIPELLDTALEKSRILSETLDKGIDGLMELELNLKEAIVNGRLGVTIATVTTMGRAPRTYLIKNDSWSVCTGNVVYPNNNIHPMKRRADWPKCYGKETVTERDPCAFNSVIKYSTIPTTRRSVYVEDNYICQRQAFVPTMEKYISVAPKTIKETCKKDVAKTVTEYELECGPRVVNEYTLYPYNWYINKLPMGYCESDGCKLSISWHITNKSVDTFDSFSIDPQVSQLFIIPQNSHGRLS